MFSLRMLKDWRKKRRAMASNCKMKDKQTDELIQRFRTLRLVYNECARAVEIHCHQLTYWREQVIPTMNEDDVAGQTSLRLDALAQTSASRQRLLQLLRALKEELSVHCQRLLNLKKAFDRLYYANGDQDEDKIQQGYSSIEEQLVQLEGVRFVPCDSLLWQPMRGRLGHLEHFPLELCEPPGDPEKLIDCPSHSVIRSPVTLIKTMFKKPLSVLTAPSSQSKSLFKSKSVPGLNHC